MFLLHIAPCLFDGGSVAIWWRFDGGLDSGFNGYFDILRIGIGRAIRSFVAWLVLLVWLSDLMNERKRMIN